LSAAAIAVCLLAACSESDDAGDAGDSATTTAAAVGSTAASTAETDTTAAASGDVRGVTADSIKVGGLGEAAVYVGLEDGARARFERANREGGVHGRMIDYVGIKDDGSDAGRDLDVTRELVDADGVFAVAPVVSQVFLPQSSDYLAEHQVPFVGWGFMPGFCGNAFGYGFNGCLISEDNINSALTDPVLDAFAEQSGKAISDIRLAIQAGDDITGKSGSVQYADTATKRGAQVVYNEQNVPSTTQVTDYSPYAQAVVASEPDIVYASVRFADVIGLTVALRQAGFEGPVVNFVTYVPGLLEAQPDLATALEGVWVNSQLPPSESGSAAVDQVAADLQAIGADPFVTLGASLGYWNADLLVQQLEAAGADLTPDTFQAAMDGFTYEPVDGGIGPVTFPKDQSEATPCAAVVQVTDGQYEVINPMACYESYPAS
jgi:ABC-type branched-subunit amino acid transport system substrate-binding protein